MEYVYHIPEQKEKETFVYYTTLVKNMKVLVATEKPFAKVAVDGIKQVVEQAGYELVLLEKYTSKQQLLEAVADVDALTTMIKGILQEVVSKNIANESTTKDVENIEFWTEVDGAVFKYEYLKSQFFETRIGVEYRQEEGTMFRCICNGDDISYLQGEVQGYLINGEFSCVEYDITSLLI